MSNVNLQSCEVQLCKVDNGHVRSTPFRWKPPAGALLPPTEAARDYSGAEQLALERLRANALVGSADTVGRKLRQLAARLQVDELVLITWTHDPAAQSHSYELLAREFSLQVQGQAT